MSLPLPESPPWVVVDTETSGLHPDDGARVACVSLTWPVLTIDHELERLQTLALPFDQGVRDKFPTTQLDFDFSGRGGKDPNLPREAWDEMLEWLRLQQLIMHNAKFDLTIMRAGTRHWPGIDLHSAFFWDTMLTQGVLDPMHPKGLDLTMKRLGIGTGKTSLESVKQWLKANKYPTHRYDLVPWPVIEPYVTTDTEDTAHLYLYQMDRMEAATQAEFDFYERNIQREHELMTALYRMEERGIGFDDAESMIAAEVLDGRAAAIEAGLPFDPTPTGVHNYFIQELKLKADRVSDRTGKATLDEEQIRKWANNGVPHAKEWSDASRLRRAVSMWYRGYPEKIGHDGRLRCTFRQGHVKSGRMSVERVQLQALPKSDKYNAVGSRDRLPIFEGVPDVRDLIHAREGHTLWNLDLSQAELRVATKFARCRRMQEMLDRGMDIHGETTKEVLHTFEDDPFWKQRRDIAKRLTFGGIFQIGGETFQRTLSKLADIHLEMPEAYRYVNGWRSMYPEFGYAYRAAEKAVVEKGYVRLAPNTDFEIKSYFSERDFTRTAWNRIVQGSLAHIFGIWLGWIEREHPGYAILTVHDSTILEVPTSEGDVVPRRVADYGAQLFTDVFQTEMKVDIDQW